MADSHDRDAASAGLTWPPKRRRLATVYDAVAGKVSHDQVLQNIDHNDAPDLQGSHVSSERRSATTATNNSNGKPTSHPPEEVLFRRRNAPERYAEYDVYFANERDLPAGGGQGVLPDSDLLTAVHGYASAFYNAVAKRERTGVAPGRTVDERSMDETALLAFGILLEEAGREVLGRRGDLVFTEEGDGSGEASDSEDVQKPALHGPEDRPRSSSASRTKRRKLAAALD